MSRLIIGASIGNCVHVAGIINFLKMAEEKGYKTKFLGPAVSIKYLLSAVQESAPYMVAVSYRLTPMTGYNLIKGLKAGIKERGLENPKYIFGGTLPVAEKAKEVGLFDKVFTGKETRAEIYAYLEGKDYNNAQDYKNDSLFERMNFNKPFPLLRHHFGLPKLEETITGIKIIAKSKVLDIISLGPDQNAQESFFRPHCMDESEKGAGGVPIRKKEDLFRIHDAAQCGNYPLMRCYSGTRDTFKMASMLLETINNAWCAVPLSWYNKLDGRGPRSLLESIKENQKLMYWHAKRNIPVEVNEAHHWSLRDAHDTIAVVMAFLAAYNAKKLGVQDYISQYMFNNPATTSINMDIAKMLAKKELIEELQDNNFNVYTQVRAGLASFPPDLDEAKGQLALSTFTGMALNPDIVHVVAYSEADHAATAEDVISSCRIARQIIKKCLDNYPEIVADKEIQKRKKELIEEAKVILATLDNFSDKEDIDSWIDPLTLSRAIKSGLIDAPHLKSNSEGAGILKTRMINGACYAYDYGEDKIIKEKERIAQLGV